MFGSFVSHNLSNEAPKGYKRLLQGRADVYLPGFAQAASLLHQELSKESPKVCLYYDPDIDGLFSGLLVEWFLGSMRCKDVEKFARLKENYRYFLNDNRSHGPQFTEAELESLRGYLLIVVDASIDPVLFDKCLSYGISVIVLDHHEIEVSDYSMGLPIASDGYVGKVNLSAFGVIVNNQYESVSQDWRFLSGAGVVHQFLKYYIAGDSSYAMVEDAEALVGITLLSDIRDLDSPYAKLYLTSTYNMTSEYLNYLVTLVSPEDKVVGAFGVPRLSRVFIDFTFSPAINAVLRANKGSFALDLLRGFDEPLLAMARAGNYLLSFKSLQQGIIEKVLASRKELLNSPSLTNDYAGLAVTVLPITDDYTLTNYTGVVAAKFTSYTSGLVLCVKDGCVLRGSFRGRYSTMDYLSLFKSLGIDCGGHGAAFGIHPTNLASFNFDLLSQKILDFEAYNLALNCNENRLLYATGNLAMLVSSTVFNLITLYNAYARDKDRIYIDYQGPDTSVVVKQSSAKYTALSVDGVDVKSFSSRELKDSYILSLLEGKFNSCTLVPKFVAPISEDAIVERLLAFQSNLFEVR